MHYESDLKWTEVKQIEPELQMNIFEDAPHVKNERIVIQT